MDKRDPLNFRNIKECEELSIYWISAALRFGCDSTTLSQGDCSEGGRENKTKNEFFCFLPRKNRFAAALHD